MVKLVLPNITRDKLWKAIIEGRFEEFMRFFFKKFVHQIDFGQPFEFLDKELAELFPESTGNVNYVDKLVKVCLKNGEARWFLVHVEVQGKKDPAFAERMYRYFYRIVDRYGLKVTAIAILTDSNKKWKPVSFHYNFMHTSLTYTFQMYKLAEQDRDMLAAEDNLFAIIMLTAYDALQRPQKDEQKLQIKTALARVLMARGYPSQAVRDIFLFIKHYTKFAESEYLRTFDRELETIVDHKTAHNMGMERGTYEI